MSIKLIEAKDVPIPHEVFVHSQGGGGRMFLAEITEKNIDNQRNDPNGWPLNAIGRDPVTNRKISLAPTTLVELARPMVK